MIGEFRKYFVLLLFFLFSVFGCGTKHGGTGSSGPDKIGKVPPKSIEEKYSQLLAVSEEKISNHNLYAFIDEWYGIPYQYGGKNKKGIDCSGFVNILYKEVFGKAITGYQVSSSIYKQCVPVAKKDLREGDLVFFSIKSPSDKIKSSEDTSAEKEISHVGVYLQNNKFVHASTKSGVVINDLNEKYYNKYFAGAGRLR